MNESIYDDLRIRIEERLTQDNVVDNGDTISLNTLQNALEKGLGKYNKYLTNDTNNFVNTFNRHTKLYRVFNKDLPAIKSISPVVEENGNYYLDLLFCDNDGKYAGEAIIDKDYNLIFNNLRKKYSRFKIKELLKNYNDKYFDYFSKLLYFSQEYPNTKCVWNGNYEPMNERVNDGFLVTHFYLDNLQSTAITFSKMEDNNIARTRSKKYGELFDYISFYQGRIMRRTPVDINDLNDLYQTVVRKELNLEKGKTLNRVK